MISENVPCPKLSFDDISQCYDIYYFHIIVFSGWNHKISFSKLWNPRLCPQLQMISSSPVFCHCFIISEGQQHIRDRVAKLSQLSQLKTSVKYIYESFNYLNISIKDSMSAKQKNVFFFSFFYWQQWWLSSAKKEATHFGFLISKVYFREAFLINELL